MGLGGVFVRRMFFKNRNSDGIRDGHERNFGSDKRKWSLVKHYLCGDELNSILEEDGFSSINCTEEKMIHSEEKISGEEKVFMLRKIEEKMDQISKDEEKFNINLSNQEKAAIIIQSAFRSFMARKQYEELKHFVVEDGGDDDGEQQSEATEALSTIVQLGDFSESGDAQETIFTIPRSELHKSRSQMFKIKEEWDDSTLSSNVLQLRIQNRLEAMTRRERALAYAFSQQLRSCSKKKTSKFDVSDTGMGWSWLERWMAARPTDNLTSDDCLSKNLETAYSHKRPIVIKKRFDVAFEEKESCGSNDVAFDVAFKESYSPVKNMLKTTTNVTRRKIYSDYGCKKKVIKASKGIPREIEEKR